MLRANGKFLDNSQLEWQSSEYAQILERKIPTKGCLLWEENFMHHLYSITFQIDWNSLVPEIGLRNFVHRDFAAINHKSDQGGWTAKWYPKKGMDKQCRMRDALKTSLFRKIIVTDKLRRDFKKVFAKLFTLQQTFLTGTRGRKVTSLLKKFCLSPEN